MKREIIVADSAGFCFGVKRAVGIAEDFAENFRLAQMESVNSFKDYTMYIEKYMEGYRWKKLFLN